MNYSTCVVVWYKEKRYCCNERDGFENWCEEAIRLIVDEFMVCRDYIKNMLSFLNIDRSKNMGTNFWPKWKLVDYNKYGNYDQFYFIFVCIDKINVSSDYEVNQIIITNSRNAKFVDFINRRFLLKSICKKYNLPKDLHSYLVNFF